MNMSSMRVLWAGVPLAFAACAGNTLDLGGKDAGSVVDSGAPSDGAVVQPGDDGATVQPGDGGGSPDSSSPSPPSGVYTGYIASYMFPDGSDTVKMTLTFDGSGDVTGTVYFGNAAPLPPPTDPNVGYPPGYSAFGNATTPYEGFDFTVLGGTYAASPRVQLSIYQQEIWKAWCALQTAYPEYAWDGEADAGCTGSVTGYACLPLGGSFTSSGTQCSISTCEDPAGMPVDCGKLTLCGALGGSACTCDASACSDPTPSTGNVAFDMRLDGDMLSGTVTGLASGSTPYDVYLTRQ